MRFLLYPFVPIAAFAGIAAVLSPPFLIALAFTTPHRAIGYAAGFWVVVAAFVMLGTLGMAMVDD